MSLIELQVDNYVRKSSRIKPVRNPHGPVNEKKAIKYLKALGVKLDRDTIAFNAALHVGGAVAFEVENHMKTFDALDGLSLSSDKAPTRFFVGRDYYEEKYEENYVLCGTWYDYRGLPDDSKILHVIDLIIVSKRSFIVLSEQLPKRR